MNTLKNAILVVGFLLLLIASLNAGEITIFDSNSVISDGNSYDMVVVKGDGTVVEMTGGDINKLITMNSSTFILSGGEIHNDSRFYDSSEVNLLGGQIDGFRAYGQSKVHIFEGTDVDGGIEICGTSVTTMEGSSGLSFDCRNKATLKVYGGTVENIVLIDSPEIRLYGGEIDEISSDESAKVIVVGYDLEAVPYGGSRDEGEITGYWNDDTPFIINLEEPTYARIILYDGIIPPECIEQPESDLDDDCKVNFTDFSKMADEWLDCGLEDPNDC